MSARILSFTTSLLEKTQDFRYFALICSFCLMLDTALSYHLGSSLMSFKLSDFGDKVNIGSFLLFLVIFSFLLAFIIPVIKQVLTFLFLMAIPWKIRSFFFPIEKYDPTTKDHFLSYSKIKAIAIKEDNKVAYQMYLNEVKSEKDYENLCYFCLTLLVTVGINLAVTCHSEHTIGAYIQTLLKTPPSFVAGIQEVFFIFLLFYCVYLGVIVYCGLSSSDRREVFIYNHGLNDKT